MMCLKHILIYAILLPVPAASPIFLAAFSVALFWSVKPCGYCLMLFTILFLSTSPSSPFITPPGPFALFITSSSPPPPSSSIIKSEQASRLDANANVDIIESSTPSAEAEESSSISDPNYIFSASAVNSTNLSDPLPNRTWISITPPIFSPPLKGYDEIAKLIALSSHRQFSTRFSDGSSRSFLSDWKSKLLRRLTFRAKRTMDPYEISERSKESLDWENRDKAAPILHPIIETVYQISLQLSHFLIKLSGKLRCESLVSYLFDRPSRWINSKVSRYQGYEYLSDAVTTSEEATEGMVGVWRYQSERFRKDPPRKGDVWTENPRWSSDDAKKSETMPASENLPLETPLAESGTESTSLESSSSSTLNANTATPSLSPLSPLESNTKFSREILPLPRGWYDLRLLSTLGIVIDFNWRRTEESMVWEVEDWMTVLEDEHNKYEAESKSDKGRAHHHTSRTTGYESGQVDAPTTAESPERMMEDRSSHGEEEGSMKKGIIDDVDVDDHDDDHDQSSNRWSRTSFLGIW